MSFADRPYRTFDAVPLAEFFAYPLVRDFFAGPNPPNAIIAGELPSDIALTTRRASSAPGGSVVLPYRRLLGGGDMQKNEKKKKKKKIEMKSVEMKSVVDQ